MRTLLALCASLLCLFSASSALAQDSTCPGKDAAAFAGVYDFTTTVIGAKGPTAKGVNGYYRMELTPDGCALNVSIVKIGFSHKLFTPETYQKGSARSRLYKPVNSVGAQVLFVDLDLVPDKGNTLSMGFHFVLYPNTFKSKPYGVWRYLGESWKNVGMWGSLEMHSSRADAIFQSPLKSQACSVQTAHNDQGTALGTVFTCKDTWVLTTNIMDQVLSSGPLMALNQGQEQYLIFQPPLVSPAGANALIRQRVLAKTDHEPVQVDIEILTDGIKAWGLEKKAPVNRWGGTIR